MANAKDSRPDNGEFAQRLTEGAYTLWQQLKTSGNKLLTDCGGYDAFDKTAKLTAKHPYACLGALLGIFVLFLPLTMTFTGFFILGGTFLTIASVLFFGCLGAFLLVFLFFGVITIAGYFGFVHLYDNSNSTSAPRHMNDHKQKTRLSVTSPKSQCCKGSISYYDQTCHVFLAGQKCHFVMFDKVQNSQHKTTHISPVQTLSPRK